jgi:BirA family biotin operon repressor/biotin-[acetyl-CoA-carboxylase] ligase
MPPRSSQTAADFEAAGLPDATSLSILCGHAIEIPVAAEAVLRGLDREYHRLLTRERAAVEADWKWRIGMLGRQVVVEMVDGSVIEGRLHEMSFEGLEVEVADGLFRAIAPEIVAHLRGA